MVQLALVVKLRSARSGMPVMTTSLSVSEVSPRAVSPLLKPASRSRPKANGVVLPGAVGASAGLTMPSSLTFETLAIDQVSLTGVTSTSTDWVSEKRSSEKPPASVGFDSIVPISTSTLKLLSESSGARTVMPDARNASNWAVVVPTPGANVTSVRPSPRTLSEVSWMLSGSDRRGAERDAGIERQLGEVVGLGGIGNVGGIIDQARGDGERDVAILGAGGGGGEAGAVGDGLHDDGVGRRDRIRVGGLGFARRLVALVDGDADVDVGIVMQRRHDCKRGKGCADLVFGAARRASR